MWNIKRLEKVISGRRAGSFAGMYIYCTEMTGKYYPRINVKNKKILTISGSGDQIIDAYFYGAREVIGFDLNHLSLKITALKFATIKSLNYKEFLHFFGTSKDNTTLDYKLYQKCQSFLKKEAKSFFDALYKYYKFDGKKLYNSAFFLKRENDFFDGKGIGFYSPQNYPNEFASRAPPLTIPSERTILKKSKKFSYKEFVFRGLQWKGSKNNNKKIIIRDKIICLQKRPCTNI